MLSVEGKSVFVRERHGKHEKCSWKKIRVFRAFRGQKITTPLLVPPLPFFAVRGTMTLSYTLLLPVVPRRPVKTIDPNADLSAIFRMAADLPVPWTGEKLFGRSAPLELEIGSGKGMFISNAAGQFPHHNFLGIEIGIKYARYSAARLIRQNRTNAVMVCGDAALVLRDTIPGGTLTAVHVYFPDPWWKRAHRKRRVLRTEVLQLIESRLMPGGKLHFWTDVEEYFTSTLKLLAQTTALQGPFEVPEQEAENEMDYRTHFERRTRLHGKKVYRAVFVKDDREFTV